MPSRATDDRLAYRKWLEAFRFTDRDWSKIKANAMRVSFNHCPAALDDLDARWRVGACLPENLTLFSGLYIGMYQGRALLAWPKPFDGATRNPALDLPPEGAPRPPRRAR
jgi:hypothetical protein